MIAPVPLLDTDRSLTEAVTVLTGAANGKYPDGNAVLVTGSEGVLVIDPSLTVHQRGGAPGRVDRVLVSHAHEDHMAGLSVLAGAAVHAHHDDLIGVQSVDGIMQVYGLPGDGSEWRAVLERDFHLRDQPHATGFADGDVFDLGGVTVRVVHLAGHTRGHSAFMVEPDGVLFVGDVDLSSFGPYYGDHWSDLDEFVASIARVRDIEAAQYVTFHHKGVVAGHAEFVRQLDAFAAVIERRDELLLELLARPRTFDDLVEHGIVYRAGSRPALFGDAVEARSIEAHLRRLGRLGAVRVEGDGYIAA